MEAEKKINRNFIKNNPGIIEDLDKFASYLFIALKSDKKLLKNTLYNTVKIEKRNLIKKMFGSKIKKKIFRSELKLRTKIGEKKFDKLLDKTKLLIKKIILELLTKTILDSYNISQDNLLFEKDQIKFNLMKYSILYELCCFEPKSQISKKKIYEYVEKEELILNKDEFRYNFRYYPIIVNLNGNLIDSIKYLLDMKDYSIHIDTQNIGRLNDIFNINIVIIHRDKNIEMKKTHGKIEINTKRPFVFLIEKKKYYRPIIFFRNYIEYHEKQTVQKNIAIKKFFYEKPDSEEFFDDESILHFFLKNLREKQEHEFVLQSKSPKPEELPEPKSPKPEKLKSPKELLEPKSPEEPAKPKSPEELQEPKSPEEPPKPEKLKSPEELQEPKSPEEPPKPHIPKLDLDIDSSSEETQQKLKKFKNLLEKLISDKNLFVCKLDDIKETVLNLVKNFNDKSIKNLLHQISGTISNFLFPKIKTVVKLYKCPKYKDLDSNEIMLVNELNEYLDDNISYNEYGLINIQRLTEIYGNSKTNDYLIRKGSSNYGDDSRTFLLNLLNVIYEKEFTHFSSNEKFGFVDRFAKLEFNNQYEIGNVIKYFNDNFSINILVINNIEKEQPIGIHTYYDIDGTIKPYTHKIDTNKNTCLLYLKKTHEHLIKINSEDKTTSIFLGEKNEIISSIVKNLNQDIPETISKILSKEHILFSPVKIVEHPKKIPPNIEYYLIKFLNIDLTFKKKHSITKRQIDQNIDTTISVNKDDIGSKLPIIKIKLDSGEKELLLGGEYEEKGLYYRNLYTKQSFSIFGKTHGISSKKGHMTLFAI